MQFRTRSMKAFAARSPRAKPSGAQDQTAYAAKDVRHELAFHSDMGHDEATCAAHGT
jgi:hypothetical protein